MKPCYWHHLLRTSGLVIALMLSPFLMADETLQLTQGAAGTYYVAAELGTGVESSMLLDTGSGYVSLSGSTFRAIQQQSTAVFLRNIRGVMANGKSQNVPVYRINSLKLSETCELTGIEVAVFPSATRDILGLNAIRLLQPLTLQLDPPALLTSCAAPANTLAARN